MLINYCVAFYQMLINIPFIYTRIKSLLFF